jgi:hypothetical protein
MGIDYNVYVGPYIKVYNPLKDSVEKYHSCVNAKCSNHKEEVSSEYCCDCGKKIKLVERSCQIRIDFDSWDECDGDILEAMFGRSPDEDYQFFIPNTGEIGLDLNVERETSVNEIDVGKPKMDINNFQLQFKKHINHIKKVFGNTNVSIQWGVLCWQS